MSSKRDVTAIDLKKVKMGYQTLSMHFPRGLSLEEFLEAMRTAGDLATQVGGIEAVVECAEALKEINL